MPPEQVASDILNTRRVPKPGRYDWLQQKLLARDSVRVFSNALQATDGIEGFMSDRPCSKRTYADGKFIGGFAGGPSSCYEYLAKELGRAGHTKKNQTH